MKIIIIGAGPAGLTAAYELLTKSDIKPIIIESEDFIGGISRTATYKGNRMDIGGHRFFSKDERVTNLWTKMLPIQGEASFDDKKLGRENLFQKAITPFFLQGERRRRYGSASGEPSGRHRDRSWKSHGNRFQCLQSLQYGECFRKYKR